MNSEELFPMFIGVWFVLGLISYFIFFVSNNAGRKKKLWIPFIIVTGASFIGFAYLMGFGGQHLYLIVPMVVFTSFVNIRSTKFCDACGKTNVSQGLFSPAKFCNKCGEALK